MLFTEPKLTDVELGVIGRIEKIRESMRFYVAEKKRWTGILRRMLLARAVQGSNSIEGYNVSDDDALAAVYEEEPLGPEDEAWLAVTGYRQAMTYILQLAHDPHFQYTAELLRGLHFMMTNHDLAKSPGLWRPGDVFVRNEQSGEIVYTGPEADLVPGLVQSLCADLNENLESHVLVRGAMAHLNFVMIHPFRDGNGRMARALQTLVLAREGVLAPEFCSIEEYLGRHTLDYYAVLGEVGRGFWQPRNDARPWVRFCLTAHFRQAQRVLRRARVSEEIWQALEDMVQRRGLHDRVVNAVYMAAYGRKVRGPMYQEIAEVSAGTATRDLQALVDAGLLLSRGERRGRYYEAPPELLELRRTIHKRISINVKEDPFAAAA